MILYSYNLHASKVAPREHHCQVWLSLGWALVPLITLSSRLFLKAEKALGPLSQV